MSLIDKLESAKKTAEDRGKIYGESHNNYQKNGQALIALFPDGLMLRTEDDFSRFILFILTSIKLTRYAENFTRGGHADSIHDLGVYSFILEDFDDHCRNGS